MDFINRKHELAHLEQEYRKKGAHFVVVYGRRRLGKTRLIEEFLKDKKNAVYHLASQEVEEQQIEEFKQSLSKVFNDEFLSRNKFTDWGSLFSYLKNVFPRDKRFILVLDEFTYLTKTNKAFPSLVQKFWDEFLSKTNVFFIVSGSLVGLMLKDVLNYDAPLYGRRTSQVLLEPLNFEESCKFLDCAFEEKVKLYSVVGGVPKYLELAQEKTVADFVRHAIEKESFFYREGSFLFSQEFKKPNVYASITRAISFGNSKLNEIANFAGLDGKEASSYIDVLAQLRFLQKKIPVTETKKYRGAVYSLNDNFLKFWFRFLSPSQSEIELRKTNEVFDRIEPGLNSLVGLGFEAVCREFIAKTDGRFTEVGSWWGHYRDDEGRKEVEIDVVALNERSKQILFGECKWQDEVDAGKLLPGLKTKASRVDWLNDSRKESFVLFGKSFKKKTDGCLCVDLKNLEKTFRS